jgi:hypothetical protein
LVLSLLRHVAKEVVDVGEEVLVGKKSSSRASVIKK